MASGRESLDQMRSSANRCRCPNRLLLALAMGGTAFLSASWERSAGRGPSLGGVAYAQSPDAGPKPEAIEAHKRAVKQFDAGDYAASLSSFQKAYDLSPTFHILYNIGRASRRTGDYIRASEAFESYLKDGGGELKEERRVDVKKKLEELKALIGSLEITVNIDGAKVFVDDAVVGESPLSSPVRVNAGPHRVKVVIDGAVPVVREVDVTSGPPIAVELELELGPKDDVPPPTSNASTGLPGSSWPSGIAVGLWVATAAFAVGAGVTGTIAIVSSNDLETMRYAGPNLQPSPDSDIRGTSDRVDTMAQVTDWLIAGAVVTGVSAIYLTIAGATETEAGASGSTPPSGSTSIGVGPGGISLRGSF